VDATTVRFGLRTVATRNGQVLLDGRPVLLLGVNRHESHPHGGIYLSMQRLGE